MRGRSILLRVRDVLRRERRQLELRRFWGLWGIYRWVGCPETRPTELGGRVLGRERNIIVFFENRKNIVIVGFVNICAFLLKSVEIS
jgi:hypothetical protein